MRILVAGATGAAGRAITSELRRREHVVRVMGRNRRRLAALPADEHVVADVRDPASLQPACAGIDLIVSTVGASLAFAPRPASPDYEQIDHLGNRALLEAADRAGVHKLVYVSVYATAEYDGLAYVRAHAAFESELARSGLAHAILRPTGFFSTFEVLVRLAAFGILPQFGDGSARTNPIAEADLASVCADGLDASGIVPVGGPEEFSRREILEMAFAARGRRPRLLPVPDALAALQIRGAGMLDRRLGQLMTFVHRVSSVDVVAPARGTQRLGEYFWSLTRR